MSLAWSDERYVRLYSRDTADWLALSWQARGLLALLLRSVDRSGVLGLGKAGREGVAMILRAPWGELAGPLEELLADGCVSLRDDGRELVVRNFVTAQNAPASDKVRQAAARERRNQGPPESRVTTGHAESRQVTPSHGPSRSVTEGNPVISALRHAPSRAVTPSHAASLPSESAHLNQPNRERETRTDEPMSDAGRAILAELQKHPSLEAVATVAMADALSAPLVGGRVKVEWIATAIAECAAKVAARVAAGDILTASQLGERLAAFASKARAPDTPRTNGAPKSRAAMQPVPPDTEEFAWQHR